MRMSQNFFALMMGVFLLSHGCGSGSDASGPTSDPTGGVTGTLVLGNAPQGVAASFAPATTNVTEKSVTWSLADAAKNATSVSISFDVATRKLTQVNVTHVSKGVLALYWSCVVSSTVNCEGVVLDTAAGKMNFEGTKVYQILNNQFTATYITLTGALTFTPKPSTPTSNTSVVPANGSLTITGASADVGTLFVPATAEVTPSDAKVVFRDSATDFGKQKILIATVRAGNVVVSFGQFTHNWLCSQPPTCTGIALDIAAGTVTFDKVNMLAYANVGAAVTLNGTITFTPVNK